ncbi:RNA ligase (ATP) [Acinetobacter sp.]|uniref:RNA ligase (ATP) n=1 Tax=Acinetobacter sp. TaxID=472 RepID=UPI003D053783
MERKLASIRTVKNIKPIDGADMIELAFVDGWQCVVKKGEFEKGDRGVYFEIDSFLPIEDRYEFLRNSCLKTIGDTEGFRLRTIKLRKQLSQGLLLPISHFPELNGEAVGADVTDLLNISLYEKPIPSELVGHIRGKFPTFIPKTNQNRIQNCPQYLTKYRDEVFEVTEKVDGTSMTVYYNNGEFGVCSRNMDLMETDGNKYWNVARKLGLESRLRALNLNLAIQGELVGPGIQANRLKLIEHQFMMFDIWDIDEQSYFTPDDRYRFLQIVNLSDPQIQHVPILSISPQLASVPSMDTFLETAGGYSNVTDGVLREGLVFKSARLINGDVLSFKAISNDYLLKYD